MYDETIVSIALCKKRLPKIKEVISHILQGSLVPNKIYIFVSEEPYFLDDGIKPEEIPPIKDPRVEFIFVKNIGRIRKIIPIMKMYFSQKNTKIILLDDDILVSKNLIQKLHDYSFKCKNSAVCVAGFTLLENPNDPMESVDNATLSWGINEPKRVDIITSGRGTLIKPEFFENKNIFNFRNVSKKYDPTITDEVFISKCLAENGITRMVIPEIDEPKHFGNYDGKWSLLKKSQPSRNPIKRNQLNDWRNILKSV